MKYIKCEELEELSGKVAPGHWDQEIIDARWDYHQKAVEIIKSLPISSPEDVLEMGTMGASLVKGSHTLDFDKNWDFPGKNPTYNHDARELPWPIESQKYQLFVALRVFQHLYPVQNECFQEAKRIASRIILVVPLGYPKSRSSRGISYADLLSWNNGVPPTSYYKTLLGDLYFWDEEALVQEGVSPSKKYNLKPTLVNATKKVLRLGCRITNRVLRPFSLELRRRASLQIREKRDHVSKTISSEILETKTRPLIVEFVGASGTGKSLLCRECLRTKRSSDNWQDATKIVGEEPETGTNFVSNEYTKVYEHLLSEKLVNMSVSEHNPFALYKALYYSDQVVRDDVAIRRLNDKICLFQEEGICDIFAKELVVIEKENAKEFCDFMSDRFIVFCEAPVDDVVDRIKQRGKISGYMGFHEGKNTDELRRYTQESRDVFENFKRIMNLNDLPYITVDCSHPVHITMKFVQEKVRSFLSSKICH